MRTKGTQHKHNTGGKYITRNSTIPERITHTEKYITKYHNTISRKISYSTKIQHKKYNMLIQHAYNTKFTKHEKYNKRWAFWVQFWRHCAVPCVKVQKGNTKNKLSPGKYYWIKKD